MMKNRWNQGMNVLSILREDDETDVPIFDSHNPGLS